MAFLTGKNNVKKYDKNGNQLIKVRFGIEMSINLIIYATIENIFIKEKNKKNLERLVNLIDVDESYSEEDFMAKQYFLTLKNIIRIINNKETDSLDILQDYLITELGDKVIDSNVIEESINAIDDALSRDPSMEEKEVLKLNRFIEERLSLKYLNDNSDELNKLLRDLAEGKSSDTHLVENWEDMISGLHSEMIRTKSTSKIEDNTINFMDPSMSDSVIGRYVDKLRSPENKLRSGYKALNKMLNGGFQEGRLYIFLGTPKSFKSGTLLNIALSVPRYNEISKEKSKNRKPIVLYYSMENDSIETLDRMFFYYFGKSIADSDMSPEEVSQAMYEATTSDTGIGVIIKYAPSNTVNTDHLYDTINQLREDGFETVLLVQDYLRRIRPSKYESEMRLAMGNIADELSILAKTENIPVVTASQLNREASNLREDMVARNARDIANQMRISHIAESVQIQQNMDYGIIVAREDVTKVNEYNETTTSSYLGFKLVASRDRQQEDKFGNKLEYFAIPFENGFKIAEDEDTDEVLYGDSVLRLSLSEEEYNEMKNIQEKTEKEIANKYKAKSFKVNDSRLPGVVTTNRKSQGIGSQFINTNKISQKLNAIGLNDPINDLNL